MAQLLHASTVAFRGRGVVILGASGSGKSALALELMALGAGLVADDRTLVEVQDGALVASCPPAISGRIEARFLGLLGADPHPPVTLALAVDLDRVEQQRLPPLRQTEIAGVSLALVHNRDERYFPAAIRQYLVHGRRD
ncbi:Serine kinase of the HPr protein, regulates carbohydrate metabolism [Marinovum algicola DG 898]|nr:Serine kinase of the HPr protein, regulates carbohydrate metabolism [Marinovum algicola DG 898]